MKIFKNKFFIIILSLAVFITVLTATLSIMGQTDPIKNVFNTVMLPLRYAADSVKQAADGFESYFTSIEDYRSENDKLREEIESLESLLVDRNAAIEENKRLRDYIEMKESFFSFELTEALIIGREGDENATFFTLNKGKNDGIDIGMTVMVNEGLVGSVCDAGDSWSTVRALNEASASAGAYVQRSGEIGVISGDISYKGTGQCSLRYLKEDADIAEGDLIYTSGNGSVYPSDIFIGRVISVGSDEFSRSKSAVVEMAVDIDVLRYVVVVTGYENSGD